MIHKIEIKKMSKKVFKSSDDSLTDAQINSNVNYLRKAFSSACYKYRQKNSNAVNYIKRNRVTCEPLEETAELDLTLYDAQQDFAYIIDEIQRGPRCLASLNIKRCNMIIDSLAPSE